MIGFHRLLAAGVPAAAALGRAQQQVTEESTTALAAAAGFVCVGAGLTAPAPARPSSVSIPAGG
jgi:hypothetical protein